MADFETRRRMMVDTQVRPSDVTKFPIIEAMLRVPREAFVPADRIEAAYLGDHIAVAPGRVILDPRTLAKMLDALDIRPGDLVLDIGCTHGYATAVLAAMAEAVVGIEEDETMAREAETALAEQGVDNAAVIVAPLAEGAPKHGPYDAILVEGAVERMSDAIPAQLKEGGRLVAIFAQGALGAVRLGYKIEGTMSWRFEFNASAPVLPGFEAKRDFAL